MKYPVFILLALLLALSACQQQPNPTSQTPTKKDSSEQIVDKSAEASASKNEVTQKKQAFQLVGDTINLNNFAFQSIPSISAFEDRMKQKGYTNIVSQDLNTRKFVRLPDPTNLNSLEELVVVNAQIKKTFFQSNQKLSASVEVYPRFFVETWNFETAEQAVNVNNKLQQFIHSNDLVNEKNYDFTIVDGTYLFYFSTDTKMFIDAMSKEAEELKKLLSTMALNAL